MPELFLELFSEEIPARMQAGAAAELARLVGAALAPLAPTGTATFHGPRRIALRADVAAAVAAAASSERGPRLAAPEPAVAGFLRKHGADRAQLRAEGDYWVLEKRAEAVSAAGLIAGALPALLRRFAWPKSMRWGGTSAFAWVRPLRRIVCLLDGVVVPFALAEGDDDGHGLAAGDLTEGHRFHAPGAFAVVSCADWADKLARHRVLVDAAERRARIGQGIAAEAAARGLVVVDDPGLLDEVAGLVEWPVPLLGRIDPAFMDLPAEVMQVSMRVNQRYFALRDAAGAPAPFFGFVANIEAADGGAAIVAGNERVLRARFADARHFWDLDRKTPLAERVAALDGMTFHAKLGSQGARAARLARLAGAIAPRVDAEAALAERAALLAKADLVTGMVGEFPELQGVMGGYYARGDNEAPAVADAIRDHYAPKGPNDIVPSARVSVAVALADKLDQLAGFFAIGERPTGSGDPYALRRAALGVIRLIRENNLRLHLRPCIEAACHLISMQPTHQPNQRIDQGWVTQDILTFVRERLIVALKATGFRHDTVAAVFAARSSRPDGYDDIVDLLARAESVRAFLDTEDGANLLVAYRRAANILRIEAKKDGSVSGALDPSLFLDPDQRTPAEIPTTTGADGQTDGTIDGGSDPALFRDAEERALAEILVQTSAMVTAEIEGENFSAAMSALAVLRFPLDAFFERVTVNAPEPKLRRNRLALLAQVRDLMNQVADFSKIEG